MERPQYIECENCYQFTTDLNRIHVVNKMTYDTAFGSFMQNPRVFCCSCYREVQGECDHSVHAGVWRNMP